MNSDQLTLWQPVSLASHSAVPGSNTARMMTATSGHRLLPLLPQHTPFGYLSRMLLTSPAWHSTTFNLTWKARTPPCKRLYFQLAPSVPHTSELAALLLRTPQEADAKSTRTQSGYTTNLTHQVLTVWPTPTAIDSGSGRINRSASPHAAERPTLALMARKAMWPTPMARDHRSGTGAQPGAGHARLLTDVLGGKLNPNWVEALMGFPQDWTAIDGPPSLARNRKAGNRREPLKACKPTATND
jgi:hypothetical protein